MIAVAVRMHPWIVGNSSAGPVTLDGHGGALMPYDYHVGVDYHKAYTHLVVQDAGGQTVRSGRVKNDPRALAGFFSKGNADVKRLKSIPCLGEFFARLVAAEIDDIGRFRSAAKLASYAGLVPSTYSSGGKTFHGRIIKAGNKWLRWAFVEAVAPAVAADPVLKFDYERLKATKGTNRAKVAVARKLLTIAYQVLRDQRDYERRDPCMRSSNESRLS